MEPEGTPGQFTGFRAVFEAAPDGILIVDRAGRIREINPAALEILGYARGELLDRSVERVVPENRRAMHGAYREAYTNEPHARPMGVGMELRALRADGREVPVEISLSPCRTPEGEFVIAVMRDISEHKRLRHLGTGALQAAEDERRRISRELHDDTAQCLAALLIRLRLLRRASDEERRTTLLDEMQEELAEAVEGVRRISRGLRPPALDDAGIETALRSHFRAVLEPTSISGTIEVDPIGSRLDKETQLVIYRVVQESLSNVIRHSGAERVRVTMAREHVNGDEEPEMLRVEIVDDGSGFDPAAMSLEAGGLGLIGMQERARIVGGRLSIESSPGPGTTVTLRVPLAPVDSESGHPAGRPGSEHA